MSDTKNYEKSKFHIKMLTTIYVTFMDSAYVTGK